MAADWSMAAEMESRRLSQIERRLAEIGSESRGQREFHADRLADVLDQVDELRGQVVSLVERVERMAKFLHELRQERKNGESTNHA
jgi:ubiquinone biosynthesis protein UbiJ